MSSIENPSFNASANTLPKLGRTLVSAGMLDHKFALDIFLRHGGYAPLQEIKNLRATGTA